MRCEDGEFMRIWQEPTMPDFKMLLLSAPGEQNIYCRHDFVRLDLPPATKLVHHRLLGRRISRMLCAPGWPSLFVSLARIFNIEEIKRNAIGQWSGFNSLIVPDLLIDNQRPSLSK
jgi:hypothetical protein